MCPKSLHQYCLISLFIGFPLLFASCEYNLKDEYYKDIELPVPRSTIDLNEIEDSLYVYDVTDINYTFHENGQILRYLSIYLDSKLLYNSQNPTAKFTIDPAQFQTGSHKLILNYTISSGSGSLGDISGAEGFSRSKEYIIYIDNIPPLKLSIQSIKIKNGSLFIEWNKPSKNNYKYITLYADYESADYEKTYILNKESTAFNDTLYTGGLVKYYLQLDGYNYSLKGDPAQFDTLGLDIDYVIDDIKSTIKFYWNQPPLYNNIKHIQINPFFGSITVDDISRGSVTVPQNLLFGQWDYYFVYVRNNNWSYHYAVHPPRAIYKGFSVSKFYNNKLNYEPKGNLYYTVGSNDSSVTNDKNLNKYFLYKIDRNTMKVTNYKYVGDNFDTYRCFFSVSDSANGYLLIDDILYHVDLQTLQISNGKSIMNLPDYKSVTYFRVTKNKLLMYNIFNTNVSIIDLNTNNILYNNITPQRINTCAISSDGKYFYDDTTFYRIADNKSIIEVLPIKVDQIPTVCFLDNQEGKCFVQRDNKGHLDLFDLKTLTFETHNMNSGSSEIFYDGYLSDFIGYSSYGCFKLYNFKTRQEASINLIETHHGDYYYYGAGRLFNSNGFGYDFKIKP